MVSGVLEEFCDRANFGDLSEVSDMSDDEYDDPSFNPPPPRIDAVEDEGQDLDLLPMDQEGLPETPTPFGLWRYETPT